MIYIVCPSNYATGGTELLHQLGAELNKQGKKACMAYVCTTENATLPLCNPKFEKYRVQACGFIEDAEENSIVVPECYATLYMRNPYKHIKQYLWWLSVDNAHVDESTADALFSDKRINHLVQSEYAWQYCKRHGVEPRFLGDYIGLEFFKHIDEERIDAVAFNQSKGYNKTSIIIQNVRNAVFIPIANMTEEEVHRTLSKCKVYVDFGNHPGQDRIPREACLSGCIVITGKEGSAGNNKDIPIKEAYKFDEAWEAVPIIEECIRNYDDYIDDFSEYKRMIQGQQKRFKEDVKSIF